MKVFKTKFAVLAGTNYKETSKKAFAFYNEIRRKTKRRPYVRSAYFKKDKIFLELFWRHLYEKQNFRDKIRRIKFFPAAVELIKNSRIEPVLIENPNKPGEMLYRFAGITNDDESFIVQIKAEKRDGKKWLMSVFPGKLF